MSWARTIFGWSRAATAQGFAVESFEVRRVAELLERQHLHGDDALHEDVFAEVDGPHAANADEFEEFVLAGDHEPLVASELELLGLEASDESGFDQAGRHFVDGGGHRAVEPEPVEFRIEAGVRDESALADTFQIFGNVRGHGHREREPIW